MIDGSTWVGFRCDIHTYPVGASQRTDSRSYNLTHLFQIVTVYPSHTMDDVVRCRQTESLRVRSTVDTHKGEYLPVGILDAAPSHVGAY
jgi:hypothetical protein